ncbi:MAG: pectate lyase, partial [Pedobacter sp.]|nr:pectate lyase [Chitinophagaceae bacterium]
FNKSKIVGYNFITVPDPSTPKGKDRVLVEDKNSTIWARFYDIDTNEPFFSGRDSQPKKTVKEIEYERRVGYAWYGTWPAHLIEKKYPKWLAANK